MNRATWTEQLRTARNEYHRLRALWLDARKSKRIRAEAEQDMQFFGSRMAWLEAALRSDEANA